MSYMMRESVCVTLGERESDVGGERGRFGKREKDEMRGCWMEGGGIAVIFLEWKPAGQFIQGKR